MDRKSINALLNPKAYPHPVGEVRCIETHISWVFLAGDFAYKIKKPVDFGFLDFSTPEKRLRCCEEEVRLNRRLAPDIYLDVVALRGTPEHPHMEGDGPVLDHAVKMRAFPADATLDREAEVTPGQIDAIADRVAAFHAGVERAPEGSDYGTPAAVMAPVRENVRHILAIGLAPVDTARIDALAAWSEAEGARLSGHFTQRRADGFIRECHGDLHLGNVAWVEGAPLIFDCIEFNPRLRFIDVISETAFMVMDLIERGHPRLAWRYLNRYLMWTGDYAGLAALRFYLVYRALVRAKVDLLRAGQDDPAARVEAMRYVDLAERLSHAGSPRLLLMHGVSGSGKSRLAGRIAEALGAVWLRSDVERKRLFGLGPLDASNCVPGGIYTPEAGRRTFDHLLGLSRVLLREGYTVIVDATFLKRIHRAPFTGLARELGVDWRIVSPRVPVATLRARVSARLRRGDDASEADLAVLEQQLADQEPLDAGEQAHALVFDAPKAGKWPGLAELIERWRVR
jgi:aminoglycoside phosphotransferase family enzyme